MLPCEQQQVMYTKNDVYHDHNMETDGISSSNDESARGGAHNNHHRHPNFLESASSFTSIDNGNKILQLSKSHSPTSIAFLFGGANTGAVKN